MATIRTQLLNALVTALQPVIPGGVSGAPARIPPDLRRIGAAAVYLSGERIEALPDGEVHRRLTVSVDILRAGDDAATAIDALVAAAESAIATDTVIAAMHARIEGIDYQYNHEGETPEAAATLTITAAYDTAAGNPSTAT